MVARKGVLGVGDGISVRISGAKSERFREEWIAPIAPLEIVGVLIDFHWELWVSPDV